MLEDTREPELDAGGLLAIDNEREQRFQKRNKPPKKRRADPVLGVELGGDPAGR